MYFVQPNDVERYALRLLLLYRNGCDSFEKLRTVNNQTYLTNREACHALGFFDNNNDCEKTLDEAITVANSFQLRELFALLLLNSSPQDPGLLWCKYCRYMADDILHDCRKINPNASLNDEIFNVALNKINDILMISGNHIANYANMPTIWEPINFQQVYRVGNLLNEELNYNENELKDFITENEPKLNNNQKNAYQTIIDRTINKRFGKNVFFIDGPGGTGKTFVYKLILAKIRSQKKVALAVASSGIAAQLLPGARTAHSRLKIPIKIDAQSTCNIKVQTDYAKFLQNAEIIIWDECPMMHRHAFEALDRTLRDIMGALDPKLKDVPFGNKIIVFGGDFRQILPVVRKGTRSEIVNAAFNRSKLWKTVQVLKLTENMRVQRLTGIDQVKALEFAEYLLRIGEGREQTYR
jgi:hypothetical protein